MKKSFKPTSGWRRAAAEADLTLDLPNDGGPMFFRRVPAGAFRMGTRGDYLDEEPQHRVRMLSAYLIGSFPVTQRQFAAWTKAKNVQHKNAFADGTLLPAENMDWNEVRRFCAWLSNLGILPQGWTASLPTECEWEYACRAGTTTEYWSGDGEAALREVGWYVGNSENCTHDVGEKPANPWGLFDVHGNVWEWCLDLWDSESYRNHIDGADDDSRSGLNFESEAGRVMRGGSWDNSARFCRSAIRYLSWPGDDRNRSLGFRVCLLPGPAGIEGGRGAPFDAGAEARGDDSPQGGTTRRESSERAGAAEKRRAQHRVTPPALPQKQNPMEGHVP